MDSIKVCALGGLDEKGRDCYVVEINNDIFVLDAGAMLPDHNIPGIDFIIPNADYLVNNKDRIKAYIITHGHDECMGALKYFYQQAPAPIYCTHSTQTIMVGQLKMLNFKMKVPYEFRVIQPSSSHNISGHMIHFFQTCHNASQSVGVAIETDKGNIIYTSDFIIDYSVKNKGFVFDIQALGRLTQKETLLLLGESKKAQTKGYCSPKHKIYLTVGKYFKDSQKRIFIDCFWQNFYRIKEICILARENNKKVYFYNDYTRDVMNIMMQVDTDLLRPVDIIEKENLLRVRSQDTVILMLGNGEELYNELSLLSRQENEDKRIILGPDDIFINAALASPTLEVAATRSVDSLYRTGCEVVWLKNKDVSAMHAHQDDLKAFLSLLTPKYYMPVRGTFVEMMANAKLALSMGIGLNHMNVFIVDNGMQIIFDESPRPKIIPNEVNQIPVTPVLVDGKGISKRGAELIEERKQLGVDGVVVVASTVSLKDKRIVAGPDCQMRGFVYVKEAEPLLKTISNIYVEEITMAFAQNDNPDFTKVANTVQDRAQKFIKRETGRTPVIIPIIATND